MLKPFENWFSKIAENETDEARIARNVRRLEELKKSVHDLSYFGLASQSGSYRILEDLLDHQIVLGRPIVHKKLKEALIGENNQKIVLDAPTRFQRLLIEAESLIQNEINQEQRKLRELSKENVRSR